MKRTAAILAIMTLASGVLGQGLINFANNSTTLISISDWSPPMPIPSGQGGAYCFALLAAPSGTTDPHVFTFTGIQGTNQNTLGRFTGGVGVVADNWAPGEAKAFYVVGWSVANNGTVFDPAWIASDPFGNFEGPPNSGFFGVSAIAPAGVAGGGPNGIPNLTVFGGSQGIPFGFVLYPIPEPSTLAAFALGLAALWARHFRKHAEK